MSLSHTPPPGWLQGHGGSHTGRQREARGGTAGWMDPSPGFPLLRSLGDLRQMAFTSSDPISHRLPDGWSSWAVCDLGGAAGDVSAGHPTVSVVCGSEALCLKGEASSCEDWPQEAVRSDERVSEWAVEMEQEVPRLSWPFWGEVDRRPLGSQPHLPCLPGKVLGLCRTCRLVPPPGESLSGALWDFPACCCSDHSVHAGHRAAWQGLCRGGAAREGAVRSSCRARARDVPAV